MIGLEMPARLKQARVILKWVGDEDPRVKCLKNRSKGSHSIDVTRMARLLITEATERR